MEYSEIYACYQCENCTFIFHVNGQVECAKCEQIITEPKDSPVKKVLH